MVTVKVTIALWAPELELKPIVLLLLLFTLSDFGICAAGSIAFDFKLLPTVIGPVIKSFSPFEHQFGQCTFSKMTVKNLN